MRGGIPLLPQYVSWLDVQLKKHRDNFTFTFTFNLYTTSTTRNVFDNMPALSFLEMIVFCSFPFNMKEWLYLNWSIQNGIIFWYGHIL
jgi:hypothetical protein